LGRFCRYKFELAEAEGEIDNAEEEFGDCKGDEDLERDALVIVALSLLSFSFDLFSFSPSIFIIE
jgi:hypothetical protein